ncbi:hypothetical protein AB0J07_34755, partial [Microbispora rosea]
PKTVRNFVELAEGTREWTHPETGEKQSAVQVVPLLPAMTFTITSRFGGPIECFRPDDGSDGCE